MKYAALLIVLSGLALAQPGGPPFAFIKQASASAWTPLSYDSCYVWLDAADSVTINHGSFQLFAWRDKSPLKHDATQTRGSAFAGATYAYNAINGLPCIRFALISQGFLRIDSLDYKSHKYTVFAVATMNTATATYGRLVGMSTDSATNDYDNASRAAVLRDVATNAVAGYRSSSLSSKAVSTATPFQMTSVFDGANHTMRINGAAGTATASTGLFNIASPSGVMHIGCAVPQNAAFWDGFIGEIIIYKGALTAPQIATVESYLKTKWGTP